MIKMKKMIMYIFVAAFCSDVIAQADFVANSETIRVNALLDSVSFYDLDFDYNKQITLPDSIKRKMTRTLCRELPKKEVARIKGIFEKDYFVKINKNEALRIKSNDSIRSFDAIYDSILQVQVNRSLQYYKTNNCIPSSLVLACGSWGVSESLPVLRHYLADSTICASHYHILAAMAKLGDSLAYDELIIRSSLDYWVKKQIVDTVSWNSRFEDLGRVYQQLRDNKGMAYYLKSKELLLCVPDYLKVKGDALVEFSGESFFSLAIVGICWELKGLYTYNENKEWSDIIETYLSVIKKVQFKEVSEAEKKMIWETYLSDAYIQKVIEDLKECIRINDEF